MNKIIKVPPVHPFAITSTFGMRTLSGKKSFHSGIDFVGWNGKNYIIADIVSTVDGKVMFAETIDKDPQKTEWGGRGNCVTVQCKQDPNVFICFYHLEKIYVKTGQEVDSVTPIGKMGNTGHSMGAHLHYEVKVASNGYMITRGIPYKSDAVDPNTLYVGDLYKEQKLISDRKCNNLKKGDSSEDVSHLQALLVKHGFEVLVDGVFGDLTEKAVKEFQFHNHITNNGIVDDITWKFLNI